MRKLLASGPVLLLLILSLSGCGTVDNINVSVSAIYSATAFLSLLLLIGCRLLVQKNKLWFTVLFSAVLVVNIGYTLLSVSTSLQMALWANRISYLGSVFLPLAMLMIILDVSDTKHPDWLHIALSALSFVMFLIAASPGILPIYYKEVSFAVIDGVSTLVKVYGPLHPIYLMFLLAYFSAMVAVIVRAKVKATIDSTAHAVILAIAVFVNIGVWLIEQIADIDFEMLSVSYIISELFLLGIHLVMNEYQRMTSIVKQIESVHQYTPAETAPDAILERPVESLSIPPERVERLIKGLNSLTPTERAIYDAYIARFTTKEIMSNLNIKESTLKFHNHNIYGKLGVSSRKELLELHKHIQFVKSRLEDTDEKNQVPSA